MKRKKQSDKIDLSTWHWPFLRINFGGAKEYACPHYVGHGGLHGCDSCCLNPSFPIKARKNQRRKYKTTL